MPDNMTQLLRQATYAGVWRLLRRTRFRGLGWQMLAEGSVEAIFDVVAWRRGRISGHDVAHRTSRRLGGSAAAVALVGAASAVGVASGPVVLSAMGVGMALGEAGVDVGWKRFRRQREQAVDAPPAQEHAASARARLPEQPLERDAACASAAGSPPGAQNPERK